MLIFLGIALYVIGGWAAMFVAATFRWTYATWLFFSLMTTAAVLLALTVQASSSNSTIELEARAKVGPKPPKNPHPKPPTLPGKAPPPTKPPHAAPPSAVSMCGRYRSCEACCASLRPLPLPLSFCSVCGC